MMLDVLPADVSWTSFNDAQADREPRPLCATVLDLAGPGAGRLAVDLGCGSGVETRALLGAGWRVLAVDSDPQLPTRFADLRPTDQLEVLVADLADVPVPAASLVHAGYALPFVAPDRFGALWDRVRDALAPGGWLAVDLFGVRDSWAGTPGVSVHDRDAVDGLLHGLDVVRLDEEERDGTAFERPKHWHVLHVVARRPG